MSSIINGQAATIQQLVTPEGIGIASGPPSLTPYSGALAWDPTTISGGSLYIGNSTNWINVAGGGGITGISTSIPVTLTSTPAGQPDITGTLYLQKITVGAISMVYFQIIMNESVTTTANCIWEQAAIVPAAYRPMQYSVFPNNVLIGGTYSFNSSYFIIDSVGDIFIGGGTIGTFVSLASSGTYFV